MDHNALINSKARVTLILTYPHSSVNTAKRHSAINANRYADGVEHRSVQTARNTPKAMWLVPLARSRASKKETQISYVVLNAQ